MMNSQEVVLVAHSPLFRKAFGQFLMDESNNVQVHAYNNVFEITKADLKGDEVIVFDLGADFDVNSAVLKHLKRHFLSHATVAISSNSHLQANFLLCKQFEINAFFSMDESDPSLILKSIQSISEVRPLSIQVEPHLKKQFLHDWLDAIDYFELSKREYLILDKILEEKTNQEISEELSLSIRTVESHRSNIIGKAGSKNSIGAIMQLLKRNDWFEN